MPFNYYYYPFLLHGILKSPFSIIPSLLLIEIYRLLKSSTMSEGWISFLIDEIGLYTLSNAGTDVYIIILLRMIRLIGSLILAIQNHFRSDYL